MSSSSEDLSSTLQDALGKPKLKASAVRTKRLMSVPEVTPEAERRSPSSTAVGKRFTSSSSLGNKASGHRPKASREMPSKPFSPPHFAPQEMTRAMPKHITAADRQPLATNSCGKSIQLETPHSTPTSRSVRKTIRHQQTEEKEAAPSVESPSLTTKTTSPSDSSPAAQTLDEAKNSTPRATCNIPLSKEQRNRGTSNVKRSSTESSSDDIFEIEHPLLRVPTSEDLVRAEIKPKNARNSALFTPPGAAQRSCRKVPKSAAKFRSRPPSTITLDDLAERLQKTPTPRQESKTKATFVVSNTAAVGPPAYSEQTSRRPRCLANDASAGRCSFAGERPVRSKRSSTSFNASRLAESNAGFPLVSREQFKRTASSTQARPVIAFTLDDMAESYKDRTWWPGRLPSVTTQGNALHRDRPYSRPARYEEARAPPSRSAVPESFAPGDYEVRHHGMSREEYLLYPLAVFLFVGFVLVVTFIVIPRHRFAKHENPYKEQLNGICQSPSCSRDAVYLNSLLSWDQVNPCHDFYAFVCRQWTGRYATPSPGSSVSADDDFASFLENKLHVRLQDDSSETNSNLRPIIDLHQKCMDTRRIEDDEWNPLLELMSLVFLEGFPLTPPVRKSLSVWRTAAKLLRKTGTAALLGIGISSNPSTVHTDLVSIRLPDTLIHNDYIDISEAIRLYTSAAFAAMNALKKQYIPPSFTLSIIKFASDLEKLADVAPTENASMAKSLQSLPQLIIFLEEIFNDVRTTLYFGEGTEVMIQPAVAVNGILQLADNTDLATVMNYLGVRLMIQVSPFIPHSGLTEFYSVLLYGKRRGNLPRWQLCLRATEKALFPLTNLAIITDLSAHVPASGLYNLTSDIVAEFRNNIDTSAYFTEESRTIIQSILNTTRLLVARPDWLNDSVAIDAYVQTLPVKLASARNSLDAYVIYHERTFLASLARGSTQRWSRSAFSTDCWYEPNLDTIYVPLLVFNISRALDKGTDAIQISRAGPRLMRCAFDALLFKTRASTGAHQRWLKGETETKLREVEACLDSREASQTTSFQRTRDMLAAHFSLELFMKAVRRSRHPIALMLPQNRSATQEQLFFIYLMLQSCERSGGVENRAPSAGYDWNIALRNTKDFPTAFLCNAESPMTVQKKCLDV